MPIAAADLKLFGSANMPDDDTSTSGGAIALATKPFFTQFGAAARPEIVSTSAADTMTVTIEGRNAAGAVISEANALNGTTPVLFAATYERILKVTLASAAAGTVTVKEGAGGTTRVTIEPGFTLVVSFFRKSSSEAAQVKRYEKPFWKNTHGTLTLTSATIKLTADPAAKIQIGGEASKDGTQSVTNRKTAPGSVTFVDDNVAQNVPGTTLEAGVAIGVWVEQTLAAADSPVKSTFTLELAGQTT